MLATAALILKQVITLFALVEPVAMIPVFVTATEGLDERGKIRFARTIALSVTIALLILIVGYICWLTFRAACSAERQIRKSTLDLVERVGGFILAVIAVEMMATGLKGLFPALGLA